MIHINESRLYEGHKVKKLSFFGCTGAKTKVGSITRGKEKEIMRGGRTKMENVEIADINIL